jgi:hypothetical protein
MPRLPSRGTRAWIQLNLLRAGGQPGETGDPVKVPVKGIDDRRTLSPSDGRHQGIGEVEIVLMVQGQGLCQQIEALDFESVGVQKLGEGLRERTLPRRAAVNVLRAASAISGGSRVR